MDNFLTRWFPPYKRKSDVNLETATKAIGIGMSDSIAFIWESHITRNTALERLYAIELFEEMIKQEEEKCIAEGHTENEGEGCARAYMRNRIREIIEKINHD
jgi:hypothetical protein